MTASTLTLEARDGVRLTAHTLGPVGNAPTTVVLVHGFAANKAEEHVAATATALVDDGHAVVVFDARGHGGSDGQCTLGDDEVRDVEAAVRWARRDADRVIVVGASMGAIATLRYAADHGEADGYVTVSAPSRWRVPATPHAILASLITQTRPGRRLASRLMQVDIRPGWSDATPPIELVARNRAPLGIVHGRKDRFIPPRDGLELYRHAGGPRRLHLVDGMGHAFEARAIAPIRDLVAWAADTARERSA